MKEKRNQKVFSYLLNTNYIVLNSNKILNLKYKKELQNLLYANEIELGKYLFMLIMN